MIMSIDAEKTFDKVQHSVMIKTLDKPGIERKFVTLIKGIYKTPQLSSHLNVRG